MTAKAFFSSEKTTVPGTSFIRVESVASLAMYAEVKSSDPLIHTLFHERELIANTEAVLRVLAFRKALEVFKDDSASGLVSPFAWGPVKESQE